MTLTDLARSINVSKSYLSEIETGVKRINGDLIESISTALGVSESDLFEPGSEAEEMKRHVEVVKSLRPEDRKAVYKMAQGLARMSKE